MTYAVPRTTRAWFGHWLVVALVVALIWAGIGLNLWREYRFAAMGAAEDTTNLARAFEENITRTVEAVDQTLLFVREAYRRDHNALDLSSWLRARSFMNDLQIQIAIADRTGKMLWSNLGAVSGEILLSDREHFRAQLATTEDSLFISRPVVGRVSNRQTIQFARKLFGPDGGFDGIVVVSLDPYYLSRFYQSLSIGNGSVALANGDGVLLARAPAPQRAIGTVLPNDARQRLLDGPPTGTFRAISAMDGVDRIYSFRRLERYPLVVSVGLAAQDVFAAYEHDKRLYLASGLLASLACIAVGLAMLRQRRSVLDSRQALAATLESMAQGVMLIRSDGSVPVVNRRAIELLGLPPSLMARRPRFQDILDWQFANGEFGPAETWSPELRRVLRGTDIAEGSQVYERTRPDGTVLEVRTYVLADRATLRTFTDITERRRNEEALAAAQVRAAHAERMQALGQLAGGIAHDFNNILQIVQGGASLIERRSGDPASAQRLARMILDATERGTSITRRLLSFARRSELRAEPVAPEPLLEELRTVLTHTLGSPIAVQVTVRPGVPAMLADKGQLETVLVNLATNARDAMPQGGTLRFAAAAETVAEDAVHPADLRSGRYVRLSIADTGAGMDRATLARVLEPFFTTKEPGKGTGLGLPMAKGMVEQSGGGLAIDSTPGGGTTVHLWLPAAGEAPPAAAPEAPRVTPAEESRARVMLVEDEALVRDSLAEALEDAGYAVLVADSGATALALLDSAERIDVLVTDLSMPGIGGLTVIRQAQRSRPGLPAVLLTGYVGDGAQLAVSGALSGAFSLLRKPVSAAQLADRIEALLVVAPTP